MSKDGNINDNSAISSGRKNENRKAYESGYERIDWNRGSNKPKKGMIEAKPGKFVGSMTDYYASYKKQKHWETYTHKTLIEDALYSIAIAISDDYKYAQGLNKFKADLKSYLEQGNDQ